MESLRIYQKSCLALAITLGSMHSIAEPVDATNTLPNAKPGECYAKVVIPAQYKTENVDVTVREASVRFETVAAEYQVVEERQQILAAFERQPDRAPVGLQRRRGVRASHDP